MAQRIVWTDTAAKQRRHILKFWKDKNKSSDYSLKLIDLIAKKTTLLSKFPELGKKTHYTSTRVSALGILVFLPSSGGQDYNNSFLGQ